ncbi:RNA-directed DNA polymerase, eukaryota, reverse transcriptase zinc-binding domain protein [Tanacetum coccineum]
MEQDSSFQSKHLAWRVLLLRLPTRFNLDHCGIDLDLVRCPLCNDDIETETYVSVNCSLARCIWKDVFSWWQLPNTSSTNLDDLFSLPDRVNMESKLNPFFSVVVNASIWSLWSYKNKVLFNIKRPKKISFSTRLSFRRSIGLLLVEANEKFLLVG